MIKNNIGINMYKLLAEYCIKFLNYHYAKEYKEVLIKDKYVKNVDNVLNIEEFDEYIIIETDKYYLYIVKTSNHQEDLKEIRKRIELYKEPKEDRGISSLKYFADFVIAKGVIIEPFSYKLEAIIKSSDSLESIVIDQITKYIKQYEDDNKYTCSIDEAISNLRIKK